MLSVLRISMAIDASRGKRSSLFYEEPAQLVSHGPPSALPLNEIIVDKK
jgi:hypothetical protein